MSTTNDPIIGKKLGNYNVVEILGKGGMARVYRGFDAKLNRYAAVKVFEAHLIPEHEQDEYRKRFENEARAIAHLRHPNVVGVYQFDQVGTLYYMAMEYIEGRDLRQILRNHAKNNTRMAYPEILRVMQDIGAALDYSHQEGVIHRDVKPSNIMVTSSGKAILTDFGLALSVPEGSAGLTFGSAHYIAPEQAVSSANAVPQSDLYSLGIVLFETLTNRVPFNDQSAMSVAIKHLNEPPPPPSQFNPNLSQAIDHVVLKALSKEPANRFATAADMARALAVAFGNDYDTDTAIPNEAEFLESWSVPSKPTNIPSLTPSNLLASAALSQSTTRPPHPQEPIDDEDDKTPTAGDSPLQPPAPQVILPLPSSQPTNKRMMPLIVGLASLGIIAIVAAVALTAATLSSGTITPTVSAVPIVAAAVTEEAASPTPSATVIVEAAVMTAEATPEATVETTVEVTIEATAAAAFTETPLPATASPTAAPTETPLSATDVPTAAADGKENTPILLRYDDESLVLMNLSDSRINVSGWSFVQTKSDGSTLIFESQRWENGITSTRALDAGECFQVQRNDIGQLDSPDYCDQQSWSRVSFPRWFWTSDDSDASFEVRRNDKVLATCTISTGECGISLPQ